MALGRIGPQADLDMARMAWLSLSRPSPSLEA
jgi:hypothetical protein